MYQRKSNQVSYFPFGPKGFFFNIIDTVGGAQCEKNPSIFLGCGPGERVCIKIYAPICGSDGKTYGNRCWLDHARRCDDPSLTIKHKGKCVPTTGTLNFISKGGRS